LSLSSSSSSSSIHHCHHYRRRHNTFNCLRPSSTLLAIGGNSNSNGNGNGNGNVNGSYNPIEDETPEERASRMELVRKLQKSFYQDEKRPTYDLNDNSSNRNTNSNSTTTTSATTDDGGNSNGGGTVITNLPLWRVQWTELPGSQNILNVHVPHYTNMFQKILQGNIKSWDDDDDADDNDDDDDNDNDNVYYFGHVFLPGGSENLDNPDYELRKGDVGVLMKISDCRQHKIDGRLTVIVQALERFTIVNPIRSHSPYAIADVEIDPDQEQIQMVTTTVAAAAAATTTVQADVRKEGEKEEGDDGDSIDKYNKQNDDKEDNTTSMTKTEVECEKERVAKAKAVAEAFSCHPFEYRSILIEDCYKQQQQQVGISPLSNYDQTKLTKLEVVVNHNNNNDNDNNNRTNTSVNMNVNVDNRVLVAESNTWMKLDEMLQLLRIASGGMMVPVPTQILGLLPHSRYILRQRVVVPNNDTDINTDTNHTNHNDDSHTSSTSDDDEQQQPMLSTMSDQVSWSSDFYLEKAALHMEGKFDRAADDDTKTSSSTSSSSTSSSTVGTYSKSPFVRVDSVFNDDDDDNNDTTSKCSSSSSSSKSDNQVYYYSPLRRAQRFSYVIWTIMESISLSRSSSSSSDATDTDTDTDRYSRQTVLELKSTTERLERATEKMEKICLLLKSMLYK